MVTTPTVEVAALFAGMAASYPLLSSLVPEVLTRFPSMPVTVQTTFFTAGVAALIGWGTKVSSSVLVGGTGLIRCRLRMVAHLDTCFAVYHDLVGVRL